MTFTGTPDDGARNMLENCAGARPGDHLLILQEDPALGFYEQGLAESVAYVARDLGLSVSCERVPFSPEGADLPASVQARMTAADHVLYLARLGDQTRFRPGPAAERSIICFALDRAAFASAFATVPHGAMLALKAAVTEALLAAHEIRVTCPLGTDFGGRIAPPADRLPDVGMKRFPMSIFAPLPMAGFRGRVALSRFLVGSGSVYYDPFALPLDGVCHVRFDGTRTLGFDGPAALCDSIRAHVARVAGSLGLDGGFVHSWHAGLHPGCAFPGRALDAPGRWGGSAFGNPRILHVHTCGDHAPGEICWNVFDPTVMLDGVPVWEAGRLHPDRVAGGAAILAGCPPLAAAFADPATAIGID